MRIITIQATVPICEECGGGLKYNQITQNYRCLHCGARYHVIDMGKSDNSFICEKLRLPQVDKC